MNNLNFIFFFRELAEWFKAVSLRLTWFKRPHPFKSDILCLYFNPISLWLFNYKFGYTIYLYINYTL